MIELQVAGLIVGLVLGSTIGGIAGMILFQLYKRVK